MLQLIVWLGCLLLVVKGLQMLQTALAAGATPAVRGIGILGFALAIVGTIAFVVIAYQRVSSIDRVVDRVMDATPDSISDLVSNETLSRAEQKAGVLIERADAIRDRLRNTLGRDPQ